jgi:hypothetical protein
MTPLRCETTDALEALAWQETQRGRSCHIESRADRDVLVAAGRVLAWAPKTGVAA